MAAVWDDARVVLDTNALLNLYRYSEEAREDLVTTLQKVRSRLWIPWQVGHEFINRRLSVINAQANTHGALKGAFSSSLKQFRSELGKFQNHATLPKEQISEIIDSFEREIGGILDNAQTADGDRWMKIARRDTNLDLLQDLYEGRVGDTYSASELTKLYAEGAHRFSKKIPPGYKDQDKPEPNRYGDLIIWRQICDHAARESSPIIFVTEDAKEDWWQEFRGETLGPRPELVQEFHDATGQSIVFYKVNTFLRQAKQRLDTGVRDSSIDEAARISGEVKTEWTFVPFEEVIIERDRLQNELSQLLRLEAEADQAAAVAEDNLARSRRIWEIRLRGEVPSDGRPLARDDLHDLDSLLTAAQAARRARANVTAQIAATRQNLAWHEGIVTSPKRPEA